MKQIITTKPSRNQFSPSQTTQGLNNCKIFPLSP